MSKYFIQYDGINIATQDGMMCLCMCMLFRCRGIG